MVYTNYLQHFNPFHDKTNGQFTTGEGSRVISSLAARRNKNNSDEEKKRQYEETKQKILREGNATDILRIKNDLSIQDLQNAINRIDLERKLARISEEELAKGKSTAQRFFDKLGKGATYLNTASNLVEATKRFAHNVIKEKESESQKRAKEFLKNNYDSDMTDLKTLESTSKYLDTLFSIEKYASGKANGKSGKKK